MSPSQRCVPTPYRPRRPSETTLYLIVQANLETFLAQAQDESGECTLPPYVEKAFRHYLECGILAHGFARARPDAMTVATISSSPSPAKGAGFALPATHGAWRTLRLI